LKDTPGRRPAAREQNDTRRLTHFKRLFRNFLPQGRRRATRPIERGTEVTRAGLPPSEVSRCTEMLPAS